MTASSDVEAICFDLDSTLCVADQSDEDIHQSVFERVGVEPFFTPADVRSVDPSDLPTAETDREYYENLYRAIVGEKPVDPDSSLLSALAEATVEVVDPTAVSFRPGARAALDYAREHYDVGLITNGGEETQTAKLEQLGVRHAFETAVFCDPAAGVEPKPDPAPFETALANLDASAGSTVYVGNSHTQDVVGAHRAGWQSVWVPRVRPHESAPEDPEPEPTHTLGSPDEIERIL